METATSSWRSTKIAGSRAPAWIWARSASPRTRSTMSPGCSSCAPHPARSSVTGSEEKVARDANSAAEIDLFVAVTAPLGIVSGSRSMRQLDLKYHAVQRGSLSRDALDLIESYLRPLLFSLRTEARSRMVAAEVSERPISC